MLLKHHEKTQELEYRQQKSVHQLREEQVNTHIVFMNILLIKITNLLFR